MAGIMEAAMQDYEWCPLDEASLVQVPRVEGIYWIRSRSRGKVIYIGRSFEGQNIHARLSRHFYRTDNNTCLAQFSNDDLEFAIATVGKGKRLQPPQAEVFQINILKPECNTVAAESRLPRSISELIDVIQGR
jgi:hypothetical protein